MEARDLSKARPQPFQLSLRIRHPTIDPAEISRELKLEADYSFKAGEPRESGSGSALTAVHSESYWLGTLDPAIWPTSLTGFGGTGSAALRRTRLASERAQAMLPSSLGLALEVGTAYFLRTHAEFMRRLQAEGGQASLLIEISPGAVPGFTVTPQIGRMINELGISMEFEFVSG